MSRVTTMKTFRQADSRWGSLGYAKAPYFMSNSGCGPTSCTNIIVSNPKYAKITPKTIRSWMIKNNGVANGQGTYWSAIPKCLKAYGFTVKQIKDKATLFSEMSKSGRRCEFLFRSGTKGGVTWTGGGHYVACSGMKIKNGKHYFYMHDSGGRHNDGWFAYETTMDGLVRYPEVYVATLSGETTTTTKKSTKLKGFDISYVQKKLTLSGFKKAKKAGWDFVIIRVGTKLLSGFYKDEEFESKYTNATNANMQVGVYFYSVAKTVAEAKAEANFVLKVLNGRKLQYPVFIDFEDPKAQANLGKKLSKQICEAFCAVIENAGYDAGVYASLYWLNTKIDTISDKYYVWMAQYNDKDTYAGRHEMWQYSSKGSVTGIGKPIDVNTSTIPIGSYPVKKTASTKKATTTKTKVTYPTLPKRGYFTMNDKGVNVTRLQKSLKAAGYNPGKIDGIYGNKTASAVRAFQKDNKLTADGVFGKKSLAALKKVI